MEIISSEESAHFQRSITTVATELSDDLGDMFDGKMDRETFLQRYGHLRPGTYDITSWRYDERPDLYLAHGNAQPKKPVHKAFEFSESTLKRIEKHLTQVGYNISSNDFLDYIALSIKGREQAKFAFTRVVSDILAKLVSWGDDVSLSRDQLSFLPINAFLKFKNKVDIVSCISEAQ